MPKASGTKGCGPELLKENYDSRLFVRLREKGFVSANSKDLTLLGNAASLWFFDSGKALAAMNYLTDLKRTRAHNAR